MKSFCRILLIQNAPEKIPMGHASPPVRAARRERSTRGQVVANIEPPPPPAVYHEEVLPTNFISILPLLWKLCIIIILRVFCSCD